MGGGVGEVDVPRCFDWHHEGTGGDHPCHGEIHPHGRGTGDGKVTGEGFIVEGR